jgi:hypothetical protein
MQFNEPNKKAHRKSVDPFRFLAARTYSAMYSRGLKPAPCKRLLQFQSTLHKKRIKEYLELVKINYQGKQRSYLEVGWLNKA